MVHETFCLYELEDTNQNRDALESGIVAMFRIIKLKWKYERCYDLDEENFFHHNKYIII